MGQRACPALIVSHKLVLARRVVMLGRKPDKERIVKAWIMLMLALSLPVAAIAEEAKEKLRQEALKQTQQVMTDETGKPVVEDLLFNNLIIQ